MEKNYIRKTRNKKRYITNNEIKKKNYFLKKRIHRRKEEQYN